MTEQITLDRLSVELQRSSYRNSRANYKLYGWNTAFSLVTRGTDLLVEQPLSDMLALQARNLIVFQNNFHWATE